MDKKIRKTAEEIQANKGLAIRRSVIKEYIYAVAPVTAKEIYSYLKSQGMECEMYEIATQLSDLIHEGLIEVGDEGNTFQPSSDETRKCLAVDKARLKAAEDALDMVMNDEELADSMPNSVQKAIDQWHACRKRSI